VVNFFGCVSIIRIPRMSMDVWTPEPCSANTKMIANAKIKEAIRVIIGCATGEGSNEMLCIISCNSSTVNNLFLSLRINAIILSCKQEIINHNSRISHVRRATNHRPDPPIRGSANYGNPYALTSVTCILCNISATVHSCHPLM